MDAPESTVGPPPPPIPPPEPRPWGFWLTLVFSIFVYGVFTVVQIPVAFVAVAFWAIVHQGSNVRAYAETLGSNGLFIAVSTCVAVPVCVGATLLLVWARNYIGFRDYLALRRVGVLRVIGWMILTVVCVFGTDYIRTALGEPPIPGEITKWFETAGFAPLLWFTIALAAPVFEEVLFRGFMFRGFAASPAGVPGAIVLTALLWAVAHLGEYGIVDVSAVFTLGLLLGLARARTGSLYVPLAMHVLNNTISTIQIEFALH